MSLSEPKLAPNIDYRLRSIHPCGHNRTCVRGNVRLCLEVLSDYADGRSETLTREDARDIADTLQDLDVQLPPIL